MGNFNTVKAITENILAVLKGEGINFSCKTYGSDEHIPASILPFGELYYEGEDFENQHAGCPGFVDARFKVRLVLGARDAADTIMNEQKWVHALRSALTVSALNSAKLASSMLVSRVTTVGMDIENKERFSVLFSRVSVRYREN